MVPAPEEEVERGQEGREDRDAQDHRAAQGQQPAQSSLGAGSAGALEEDGVVRGGPGNRAVQGELENDLQDLDELLEGHDALEVGHGIELGEARLQGLERQRRRPLQDVARDARRGEHAKRRDEEHQGSAEGRPSKDERAAEAAGDDRTQPVEPRRAERPAEDEKAREHHHARDLGAPRDLALLLRLLDPARSRFFGLLGAVGGCHAGSLPPRKLGDEARCIRRERPADPGDRGSGRCDEDGERGDARGHLRGITHVQDLHLG